MRNAVHPAGVVGKMRSRDSVNDVHTVAAVVNDAVNPFELAVATEVFGFDRPELGVPWYRFLICAVEPRPIRTSINMYLTTPYTLQYLAEADTVIVPSSRPGIVPVPEELLEALREAYRRGARIIAFCTGSFVLAAAGLLDGRRATTHWAWAVWAVSIRCSRAHELRLLRRTAQR